MRDATELTDQLVAGGDDRLCVDDCLLRQISQRGDMSGHTQHELVKLPCGLFCLGPLSRGNCSSLSTVVFGTGRACENRVWTGGRTWLRIEDRRIGIHRSWSISRLGRVRA